MTGQEVLAPATETEALRQQLLQAQRLSSVGELASSIAHEFNNILTTIINYAKMGVRGAENKSQTQAFERILKGGQRAATIVFRKSTREGFGLTVAEAMWKARPVVATRVGGIQDQIEDGKSGVLVDDPEDLAGFADAVAKLLSDPAAADRLGAAARTRIRKQFLAPRLLMQHVELARKVLDSTN